MSIKNFVILAQNEDVPFVQSENVPLLRVIRRGIDGHGTTDDQRSERERAGVVRSTVAGQLRRREGAERLGFACGR